MSSSVTNQIHEISSIRAALSELDDVFKRQRAEWDVETQRLRAELQSALNGGGGPIPHGDSDRERVDRYGGGGYGGRRGPDGDVEMLDSRERDLRDRDRERGRDRDERERDRERERERERDREMRQRDKKIPKSERTYEYQ